MSGSLSAAAQDRKARLAQLKSLKRKQPDEYQETDETNLDTTAQPAAKSPRLSTSPTRSPSRQSVEPIPTYLSGRNYDSTTRGPKLGFESAPISTETTLESRVSALSAEAKAEAARVAAEAEDKPLDLFQLQPKKPNWDLKRDLERKMEVLNVRTENAIARLVRERIAGAKAKATAKDAAAGMGPARRENGDAGGEELGMEGATLVEATKEREREDEEDARRERELEEEYLDAS